MSVNGSPQDHDVEPRTLLVQYLASPVASPARRSAATPRPAAPARCCVDGESVKSCTMFARPGRRRLRHHDRGTRPSDSDLHPVQQAFHENHGLQCGFCTAGMVMAAVSLLEENPDPTEEQVRLGLEGNLCRCTGYHNIVQVRPGRGRPPMGCGDDRRRRHRGSSGGRTPRCSPVSRQLRRRPCRPGGAARQARAQHVRARAHRVDRHDCGGGDARRRRGPDRRRPARRVVQRHCPARGRSPTT